MPTFIQVYKMAWHKEYTRTANGCANIQAHTFDCRFNSGGLFHLYRFSDMKGLSPQDKKLIIVSVIVLISELGYFFLLYFLDKVL